MNKNRHFIFTGVGAFVIFLLLDQLTKYLAEHFLAESPGIKLIPGVFQLYYVQNTGAAFGIMNGRQWFMVMISAIILAFCIYVYYCIPDASSYKLLRWICLLIGAGAVGNSIDRIWHHYVIDFLYFSLIDFPVFNLADCYVVIGVILFMIALFTVYKDENFAFLKP